MRSPTDLTTHRAQDVVATEAEAAVLQMSPLIITESVRRYLDEHGIGRGPLTINPIGEGQSNVTFRIRRHGADIVLRRGPRPPHPKSTHDMVREARVQAALADSGFPVPTIRTVESSGAVLGVPFYIMDYLQGDVITSVLPESFKSNERRRELVEQAVSTLSGLHSLDVTKGALSTLGRPEGYLERQVRRFTQLWPQNTLRDLPLMKRLSAWLSDNVPTTQRHAVIHGDFRIGNLMFAKEDHPRVQAVLDWEMATLGDPLADVGYLLATYASRGVRPTVMELTTVTREEGFPDRDEVIDLYSQKSDLDLESLHWYEVLALWKAAIFCEAIYTRWLQGERPDDAQFSSRLKTGVPELFEAAWERAHRSP